jgi:hypothetical protein
MLRKLHSDVGTSLLVVGGASWAIIGLFGLTVLSTVVGAITGWCVSWFFDDMIRAVLVQFHVFGVGPVELGAFLGFVAPFFRSVGSK